MRLGGPVYADATDPDAYCRAARQAGYGAIYAPIEPDAPDDLIKRFVEAAKRNNIVIAEVGAWSNPISSDPAERSAALTKCRKALDLAERLGARCCVNITGSRGPKWDGPDPRDLTPETFDMIVQSAREIIDDVQPKRSCYALETMPWMYPDSPDSYLDLIRAIDRTGMGVHLDPVNLVNSPSRCFNNAALIRECFAKLGPMIKSCHGKDIFLRSNLTVHLDEVRPGLGTLDYGVFLRELDKLEPDTPLLLEHLPTREEYALAAEFVREKARQEGVELR